MIHISDNKLHIFTLLLLVAVVACEIKIFTAYEGGKVEMQCPYEPKYEYHGKYICRGNCPVYSKDIPVKYGSPVKDERFSLTDNKTAHIFTVTITDLRTEDEGKYWCAVETRDFKFDDYKEIRLKVKSVIQASGVTGENLTITCFTESTKKDLINLICKESDQYPCKNVIKVSSKITNNGRFSLSDDFVKKEFTVNIRDLTEEDTGIYWCGAVDNQKDYEWFSAINLRIFDGTSRSTLPKTTTSTKFDTSKPVDSTPRKKAVTSSIYSSLTTSLFLSTSANAVRLETQPVNIKVIMVLAIVMLTVFGLLLFVYLRWRRKKKDVASGPTVNLPNEHVDTTRKAYHAVSVYDEIKDHPVYSVVAPEPDTSVYALVQLPSSPSDDLNYSTVKFSVVRPLDRTCDGLDTCPYATVSL